MRRLNGWAWAVFVLITLTTSGQGISDTVRISEVLILAKKKVEEAGLKVTRPDSMQMVSSLTTDLGELISDYLPVFIKSYGRGSEATASFRGTASSHTQVLWNGMNLNSPMRGMADLSLLPVFFVDDVYLLHGGSSLTQGSGALGGSIHLENKPDWNTAFQVGGLLETSSFHSRKLFIKGQYGDRKFQTSTRIFFDASKNDFPFFNSGVLPAKMDTLKNAGYHKYGILQEFYFRPKINQVSGVRLWYQHSDRNLPQLMSYQGSQRDEHRNDSQFRGQFDWKKYSDGLNYHFFTGVNAVRLNYYRATPAFQFVNEDSHSRETSLVNHLRIKKQFNTKMQGTAGFDMNYHAVELKNRQLGVGYKNNRLETSLLLNLHYKPFKRLAAFVLLRSEHYDRKVAPLIPSLGVEWQIVKTWPFLLSANAARNYHKPALNDLYWLPGGNPDLLPENGYHMDISLSGNHTSGNVTLQHELTGFYARVKNWIIWQPAASGAYYWEANNLKDVLSRGVEYQYSAAVNVQKVQVRTGGNYAFTSTANLHAVRPADESRGKQLIYIPKHKGGIYFSGYWKQFTLKYDFNGIGKRYTKSSNQESTFEQVLNPYFISKISFGKQTNWNDVIFLMKFTVDNLLDQPYQSILWRPMPGRFYTLSLAINFRE